MQANDVRARADRVCSQQLHEPMGNVTIQNHSVHMECRRHAPPGRVVEMVTRGRGSCLGPTGASLSTWPVSALILSTISRVLVSAGVTQCHQIIIRRGLRNRLLPGRVGPCDDGYNVSTGEQGALVLGLREVIIDAVDSRQLHQLRMPILRALLPEYVAREPLCRDSVWPALSAEMPMASAGSPVSVRTVRPGRRTRRGHAQLVGDGLEASFAAGIRLRRIPAVARVVGDVPECADICLQVARDVSRTARIRPGPLQILQRISPTETQVLVASGVLVGLGAGIGAVIFRYLINGFMYVFFDVVRPAWPPRLVPRQSSRYRPWAVCCLGR